VSLRSAAADLLADLAPVLARWGRWYLFGAQAVVAYGVPRLSADVDVTLLLDPMEPERFASDMQAAGFELMVNDPGFVRATRVMPFVHSRTAIPLDVVLGGPGLEEEFQKGARPVTIGDATVPVIDVGDLLVAKILAGRPKDLEDASALWRIHGERLDVVRIEGLLQLIEEALGQSDLLPAFRALRTRRA
jgi:hypothetical protein